MTLFARLSLFFPFLFLKKTLSGRLYEFQSANGIPKRPTSLPLLNGFRDLKSVVPSRENTSKAGSKRNMNGINHAPCRTPMATLNVRLSYLTFRFHMYRFADIIRRTQHLPTAALIHLLVSVRIPFSSASSSLKKWLDIGGLHLILKVTLGQRMLKNVLFTLFLLTGWMTFYQTCKDTSTLYTCILIGYGKELIRFL